MLNDLFIYLHSVFDHISTMTTLKWLLLIVICVLVILMLFMELRKMQRYYHRLTTAASNQDTAALDYSLTLLSRLSRSIFMLCIAFVVLTFSIITIDIKKHHLEAMRIVVEQNQPDCNTLPVHPTDIQ